MALGEIKKYFPNLALGYNPNLPPRAMDPDNGLPYLFTDSLNYVVYDGHLRRRNIFAAGDSALQPGSPLGVSNETVLWCGFIDIGPSDYTTVLVTSSQLWVKPSSSSGSWVNCTPTYATGTITATNGSGNITGAGTLWQSLKIGRFSAITIGGSNYTITSITSDTTATISPVFAGSTGAGKAYTITRLFGNNSFSPYFVTYFNFNLYVAGDYCGGPDTTGTGNIPAVIKVTNVSSTSPTTSYITALYQISSGLDFIPLSRVAGLAALQDGRIVVAGSQSTIYYSSLLSDTVWTSSPGGNTPVTLIPGKINALGQISNNLTLHHNRGVVFGYPTGQADPPLRFQASSAAEGCYSPRTLKSFNGSEIFVTPSGSIGRFDGSSVTDIGGPIRTSMRGTSKLTLSLMYAALDEDRGTYTLMQNPTGAGYTLLWHLDIESGQWFPCRVGATIGSMSDGVPAIGYDTTYRALVGLLTTSAGTDLTAFYKETTDRDTIPIVDNGSIYFATDDIDFGDPRSRKCIQRIIFWADHSSGSNESVQMLISRDNGRSWTTALGTMMSVSERESVYQFCFDELTPGAGNQWRFRFGPTSTNITTLRPLRMLVIALESGAADDIDL